MMTLTQVKRLLRKAKKRIDKWFKDEDNKEYKDQKFNLTFRLLRHTYCTALYDAGIDEVSAAEIMGHSVSVMREIYTHITNERRKNTSIKMNNLYKLRVVKKGCEKYKKISYNKDKLTISGK